MKYILIAFISLTCVSCSGNFSWDLRVLPEINNIEQK